jgi:hypothetical protein
MCLSLERGCTEAEPLCSIQCNQKFVPMKKARQFIYYIITPALTCDTGRQHLNRTISCMTQKAYTWVEQSHV